MFEKLFYLINGIIAIATFIIIVLATVNSIIPFSSFFDAKVRDSGFTVVTSPAYDQGKAVER